MKVELEIARDSFKNERGEEVEYFRCEAELHGEVIRFTPRKEDKKLMEFLLKTSEEEV